MRIVRNTVAYETAIKAATGTIEVIPGAGEDGKDKYVKTDKIKKWITTRNKKGQECIKRIAIALEDLFTDDSGDFSMPLFNRVKIDQELGCIELSDGTLDGSVIVKPEK